MWGPLVGPHALDRCSRPRARSGGHGSTRGPTDPTLIRSNIHGPELSVQAVSSGANWTKLLDVVDKGLSFGLGIDVVLLH